MGRDRFLKELGISPRIDGLGDALIEVIKRRMTNDSSDVKYHGVGDEAVSEIQDVKEVPVQSDGYNEGASEEYGKTIDEEDTRQIKVADLEQRLQKIEQERDAATTEVKALKDGYAKEAKVAKAESEDIKSQLRGSKGIMNSLKSKVEAMEAEIGRAKCPDCGLIVGWDTLPPKWHNETELKPKYHSSILPILSKRHGKKCPCCHYFEEIKK